MIGYITGKVKGVLRDTVVVLLENGLGYRVRTLAPVVARVQENDVLDLWTYLAVRENAHDLYGFETKEDLQWFELLLTVSGIGPRSALAVMESAPVELLKQAVAENNAELLTRASGVGRKTAEKIVLELKEKVVVEDGATPSADSEIVEALAALGYSIKEARDAARAVSKEITGTENRVREAIRLAAGSK